MEWLEQSLDSLVRLKTKFGANGINYVDKQRGILIKRFNSLLQIEEREKTLDYLMLFSSIKGSGYPQELLTYDGQVEGYVTTYFEGALPFGTCNHFTFSEKIHAMKDTTYQLKQIHNRGIIFNDMNMGNQLISPQGGHLVDFEDVWPQTKRYNPKARYFLYYHKDYLPSSKKQDQLKQYIVDLGLLYDINLERFYYQLGRVEDLPELFSVNQDISQFLEDNIQKLDDPNEELLEYFDELLPKLEDEEKIKWEENQLKQHSIVKTLKLS